MDNPINTPWCPTQFGISTFPTFINIAAEEEAADIAMVERIRGILASHFTEETP